MSGGLEDSSWPEDDIARDHDSPFLYHHDVPRPEPSFDGHVLPPPTADGTGHFGTEAREKLNTSFGITPQQRPSASAAEVPDGSRSFPGQNKSQVCRTSSGMNIANGKDGHGSGSGLIGYENLQEQRQTSPPRAVTTAATIPPAPVANPQLASKSYQPVQHRVERLNEQTGRMLRVTQKELSVIGCARISTKIELLETEHDGSMTVVFSVKHTHELAWKKQLQVHKNLLLACLLAGVDCPIEVPVDSVKVFRSTENIQHIHIYLERVIPRFRFQSLRPETSAFWWRAVGCGSLVFQNFITGRLVILPCRQKGLVPAAQTLQRALVLLRNFPRRFYEMDPDYAKITLAAEEEARASSMQTFPYVERAAEAVQAWALEDGVSPWMTKLIVKSTKQRGQIIQHRYSIGVDVAAALTDPYLPVNGGNQNDSPDGRGAQLFIAIQVHANEPLSRELKAYPVCMVPLAVESLEHQALTALYLRALWFLRKLFEYHMNAELAANGGSQTRSTTTFGRLRPVTDGVARGPQESLIRQPQTAQDLQARSRLIGGARLAPYRGRFRSNPMHDLTAQLQSPRDPMVTTHTIAATTRLPNTVHATTTSGDDDGDIVGDSKLSLSSPHRRQDSMQRSCLDDNEVLDNEIDPIGLQSGNQRRASSNTGHYRMADESAAEDGIITANMVAATAAAADGRRREPPTTNSKAASSSINSPVHNVEGNGAPSPLAELRETEVLQGCFGVMDPVAVKTRDRTRARGFSLNGEKRKFGASGNCSVAETVEQPIDEAYS